MPVNEDIIIGDQVRNGGLKVRIRSAGLLNGGTGEVRGQKVEIFSKSCGMVIILAKEMLPAEMEMKMEGGR